MKKYLLFLIEFLLSKAPINFHSRNARDLKWITDKLVSVENIVFVQRIFATSNLLGKQLRHLPTYLPTYHANVNISRLEETSFEW